MWRQIGVDVKIEEITVAKYLELNHAAKLPGIMLYSWANATGDPENYTGPHSQSGAALLGLEGAVAKASGFRKLFAMKLGERAAGGISQAQQEASENSWSIPLLQQAANIVTKKTVDLPTYSQGYILPAEAQAEGVKTHVMPASSPRKAGTHTPWLVDMTCASSSLDHG